MRQLSFCFSLNLARAGALIPSTEEWIFHSPESYSVKVLPLCYSSRISCMDGILVRWRNSHDEQLPALQLPPALLPFTTGSMSTSQEPEMRSENIQGSHGGLQGSTVHPCNESDVNSESYFTKANVSNVPWPVPAQAHVGAQSQERTPSPTSAPILNQTLQLLPQKSCSEGD